MSDHDPTDHQPTVQDAVDPDQPGERLDAAKLPEEFPERPIAAFEHGTTEREMAEGESLDGRLGRELPDVGEGGDEALQSTSATPLLDDADDDGRDLEKDLVGEMATAEPNVDDEYARPEEPVSAEEAAIRIEPVDQVPGAVDHPEVWPDEEDEPGS